MTRVSTVVVAGGSARRMGGLDKPALVVGGVSLLDRVLLAAQPLSRLLLVVGPAKPTQVADVTFLSEPSPGGGPVPAVLAALDSLPAEEGIVLVLAADLPLLTSAHLRLLVDHLVNDQTLDAAAAIENGRLNPLVAAYRVPILRTAAARTQGPSGPLSGQLGPGSAAAELLPPTTGAVALPPFATFNVNTPTDLARAEDLLAQVTRSAPA